MLTVSVKNLGPIAEGTVDLKPLTIFVGPSNTGKSYMATAIYGVMKALKRDNLVAPRRMFVGGAMYTDKVIGNLWEVPSEDSVFGNDVWKWASQLKKEELDPQQLTVSSLPETVRAMFEGITVQEMGEARSDAIRHLREAHRGEAGFVTRGRQPEDFRLNIHRDAPPLNMDIQLVDEESGSLYCDISSAEVEPSPLVLLDYKPTLNEEPIDVFFEVVSSWMDSVTAKMLHGVPEQSYYLPAARSGIVQGHKVLATDILRRSARQGRPTENIPRLPGVTTEFVGNLIGLDRRMRDPTPDPAMDNAISFIEDEVLHGKIDLDQSTASRISEIVYLPSGAQSESGEFTLDETSSMVSELAPLILFLKYLVRRGDLLILEEPESHLHPAAQQKMVQGLVQLVNSGVKVIITTHSEWVLWEVANLVRMSELPLELRNGIDGADHAIKADEVGAWVFEPDAEMGGSVVRGIPLDIESGTFPAGYGLVTESIYKRWSTINRRIRKM